MEVNEYFRILKTFPIFFFVKNIQNQKWESGGRNASRFQIRWCKSSIESMLFSKCSSPFCKFLESFSPFLSHFVTWSREYCKWLNRLRRHIQIGRLSVQTPWAFWQAWWPTVPTRSKAVMKIRWWRFPSG